MGLSLCAALVGIAVQVPVEAGVRELIRSIEGRKVVTIGDGVRLVALFAGLSKGEMDEAAAQKALAKAKLLKPNDATDYKATLSRGMACYMFFRAMKMKGGLSTRLFGPSPRYCYKEFLDRRLISAEGENSPISGGELVSLLRLATSHQKIGGGI